MVHANSTRLLLIAALFVASSVAEDLSETEFWALMNQRYAENNVNLAGSPYTKFIEDPFARFTRDPDAVPLPSDVVVDATWTIVHPEPSATVVEVFTNRLHGFFQEVMGIDLALSANVIPSDSPYILLSDSGGGNPGVEESYTLEVAAGRIAVTGVDASGLRDGIVRLIDLFGFEQAPWLAPQETVYTPKLKRRMGTYGAEHTIFMGNNSLMVWAGSLYAVSTSDAIPELDERRTPGELTTLANAVASAVEMGIRPMIHLDTRSKFVENSPVLLAHPEIRGARTWSADGEFVLCTETPLVQQYLTETIAGIMNAAPDLAGIRIIIGGEGFYHCFMHSYGTSIGHTNCTSPGNCEAKGPDEVVSHLCNYLADAARTVNPDAVIEAWPYSAQYSWSSDIYQTGFIRRLNSGVNLLTEMVKDSVVQKPYGISKLLWDYSIDMIGPGPRSAEQLRLCQEEGIGASVLSMASGSFEASALPEIPCMERWADRSIALANNGIQSTYIWQMGPYFGGIVPEIHKYFMWDPAPDKEALLDSLAARVAGRDAGPYLREAWDRVSKAIEWTPSIGLYYQGPHYLGPAHPMQANPNATVPDIFYGYYLFHIEISESNAVVAKPTYFTMPDGGGQRAEFGLCFEQKRDNLAAAVAALDTAKPLVPERCRMAFESQEWSIRWHYHTARTETNFTESCALRDRLMVLAAQPSLSETQRNEAASKLTRWHAVLLDEQENVEDAIPIANADIRLDMYHRGDHSFNHLTDMLAAKRSLLEDEIDVYLPTLAAQLGVEIGSGGEGEGEGEAEIEIWTDDFEDGDTTGSPTGWMDYDVASGGFYVSCGGNDFAATTTLPYEGAYSLEWSPVGFVGQGTCTTNPQGGFMIYFLPLTPGVDYTLLATHIKLTGYINVAALEPGVVVSAYMADVVDLAPMSANVEGPYVGGEPGWRPITILLELADLATSHNLAGLYITMNAPGGAAGTIFLDSFRTALVSAPPVFASRAYNIPEGGNVCMTVSNPGIAGPGDFEWSFSPSAGEFSEEILVQTDGTLCLTGVELAGAGTYLATFDNGYSSVPATFVAELTVLQGMPVTGVLGIVALLSGLATGGCLGLRLRRR